RARVTCSLRAADMVIAPTSSMLAELNRYYGPLRLAAVIPNARDPRDFRIAPKEPLVLTAGRLWDEAKNVSSLCEAATSLPWPVCVAGATTGPAGSQPLLRGVRYLGQLSRAELSAWYARAAVYALPA